MKMHQTSKITNNWYISLIWAKMENLRNPYLLYCWRYCPLQGKIFTKFLTLGHCLFHFKISRSLPHPWMTSTRTDWNGVILFIAANSTHWSVQRVLNDFKRTKQGALNDLYRAGLSHERIIWLPFTTPLSLQYARPTTHRKTTGCRQPPFTHCDGRWVILPNHIRVRTCSALAPMWTPAINESAELTLGVL